MEVRIQKYLANLGFGSRRHIEKLMSDSKITINGKVPEPGVKVSGREVIKVNGHVVTRKSNDEARMIVYNKPLGEVCTRRDEEGRPTVFANLPRLKGSRWINVGRLDINSQGLLLFTTCGETANKLMHPSNEVSREYMVRVLGKLSSDELKKAASRVEIEPGDFSRFVKIQLISDKGINCWYKVILKSGKNREVRKIFSALGYQVSRLIRTRYGNIVLPKKLSLGKYQEVNLNTLDFI